MKIDNVVEKYLSEAEEFGVTLLKGMLKKNTYSSYETFRNIAFSQPTIKNALNKKVMTKEEAEKMIKQAWDETPRPRLKEDINEAKMKDFDTYVKKIARMTDRNDHNAARKTAAELMKLVTKKHEYEGFVSQYDGIAYAHKKQGHMSQDLMQRRDNTDKAFFDMIKKDLPKDLFDKLWSAF